MKAYRLKPTCKDYIWGGNVLKNDWNKDADSDRVAECWELSCHPDGASYLEDRTTLRDLVNQHPEYLGERARRFSDFPVLIKLIDAASNLSIQVHPSDEYALKNEGQYGKTEMWYIVDAKPEAGVYCGFKEPLSKQEIRDYLESGKICDALNFIKVNKGDTLFIEAGTVHAICGGLVICEVQQNSSITYRLYDYDRTDAKGNKRELHIDKSIDVIAGDRVVELNSSVKKITENITRLAKCKYFLVEEVKGRVKDVCDESSFTAINFLSSGTLKAGGELYKAEKGETFFLPAGIMDYELDAELVIRTRV